METQAEPIHDEPPKEPCPAPQWLLYAKDFEIEYEDHVDIALRIRTATITKYGDDMDTPDVIKELEVLSNGASVKEKPKPGTEHLAKIALLLKARLDREVYMTTNLSNDLTIEKEGRLKELQQHAIDCDNFQQMQQNYNALHNDYEQTLEQLPARTKELI